MSKKVRTFLGLTTALLTINSSNILAQVINYEQEWQSSLGGTGWYFTMTVPEASGYLQQYYF